jgi:NAD(P)-dependent dehydrogenase (short-subunit alcohol dehydrogenase family)
LCYAGVKSLLLAMSKMKRPFLTHHSGIGLETAVLFLREGANVLLSDISEKALEKAVAKLKTVVPEAKKIETKITDVSKESDVQAMVEHVDSWGGLDVIFNNAGIMHAADDDAINTPEKIWDLTQAINVKGVWFGSKHAVLSFRKHGKKKTSVINTASVVALVGSATPQLAYTASKGAVLAMTRELAMVHAREGFRFNALCPAPLKYVQDSKSHVLKLLTAYSTPLLQDWLGDDQAKRHRREVHFPTGRFGEAIEQAQAVLFLASDESSFP